MEMPRLNKSVRRVVKLQRDDDGTLVPTLIYKGGAKKRKVSSGLKPLERGVRKIARAHVRFADSYLGKHERSNRKRKDGFLKDFVSNVTNSGSKARKTLTKNSMRWPTILKVN